MLKALLESGNYVSPFLQTLSSDLTGDFSSEINNVYAPDFSQLKKLIDLQHIDVETTTTFGLGLFNEEIKTFTLTGIANNEIDVADNNQEQKKTERVEKKIKINVKKKTLNLPLLGIVSAPLILDFFCKGELSSDGVAFSSAILFSVGFIKFIKFVVNNPSRY